MLEYRVPVREMCATLSALRALDRLHGAGLQPDLTTEVVDAVLDEAARFAERELCPLYHSADVHGARLVDGQVRTAPGLREAYAKFVAAGWGGIAAPTAFGGQGLPNCVAVPINEIWRQANLSFALCPMLTQSATEALARHGSDDLKARYLPKLATGEWTGTMNLTEPQAGSDLAAIKTLATPEGDHYRIKGRKVFITWGDHDLAENIVHFVLARTPEAPEGVKGISLFLVPKYLPLASGAPGERNEISVVSLEHKLGIRASPTCVLSYGDERGAVGYLVGGLHEGLACMFTMMNRARLAVGVEALAVAQRAYRQAASYARDRVQGRAPGRAERGAIIAHPDVRRMLLVMKAQLAAMHGLAYFAAIELDLAEAQLHGAVVSRASLLTPIVKGWCSETAQEVVALALQVHGGAGYIEETGAAQPLRDVRITTIYEGTTGIQANDLVKRKLAADRGRAAFALLADVRNSIRECAAFGATVAQRFEMAVTDLEQSVAFFLEGQRADPALGGAVGVNLLLAFGTVLGGWQVLRHAAAQGAAGKPPDVLADFYAEHVLPRASAYCAAVRAGSASIMAPDEAWF